MKLSPGPTTTAVKISALNGGIKSLNHKINWIYDEYTPQNKHEGKTWNQSCMAKDGGKNE